MRTLCRALLPGTTAVVVVVDVVTIHNNSKSPKKNILEENKNAIYPSMQSRGRTAYYYTIIL